MKQTRPGQFKVMMKILLQNAPKGYTPWIFPVQKNSKAPSTKISWKASKSRLTIPEAVHRLRNNYGNVGLAGKPDDQLILLDVDNPSILDEVKDTLKIRSRSRGTDEKPAIHAVYWANEDDEELPCNIPTEKGEIRSSDQYVVAPGSYVPCTENELSDKVEDGELTDKEKQEIMEDKFRGYYTIYEEKPIAEITFNELPEIFKEAYQAEGEEKESTKESYNPKKIEGNKQTSALFDLEISDMTGRGFTERDPHPLHDSETGANWSINGGVGHCWRHLVSLNALQFLCVEAGYLTCLEAGSPHHNSSASQSEVTGNDQAIWVAWYHAKKNGYISKDDPVPLRAMHYIARRHDIYDPDAGELLPVDSYNKVIKTIDGEYQ